MLFLWRNLGLNNYEKWNLAQIPELADLSWEGKRHSWDQEGITSLSRFKEEHSPSAPETSLPQRPRHSTGGASVTAPGGPELQHSFLSFCEFSNTQSSKPMTQGFLCQHCDDCWENLFSGLFLEFHNEWINERRKERKKGKKGLQKASVTFLQCTQLSQTAWLKFTTSNRAKTTSLHFDCHASSFYEMDSIENRCCWSNTMLKYSLSSFIFPFSSL